MYDAFQINCAVILRIIGPTECQDGVTNNCSQACTRNILGDYECSCNDGYALQMDLCVGEYLK